MKKLILILSLLALVLPAQAQKNPYQIDDECYSYFRISEQNVDNFESDEFETAVQALLESSLRKKDAKAQTIYYVEILKRVSHEAQYKRNKDISSWDSGMWNSKVEDARETTQRISKATGYMQYYYYASELCQTYYFNTQQDTHAAEMLTSMMEEAKETGDEYALWKSLMSLSKLYLRMSDIVNTQKCLLQVVKIFETSQDATIRRQSMNIQYCDLADTYPVASDSARMYYGKAADCRVSLMDSVRVAYYGAQLDAWDNNLPEYRNKRDYCLSKPVFHNTIRSGKVVFNCIDNILAGNSASIEKDIRSLYYRQQMGFLAGFASTRGQWETSARILSLLSSRLYGDISRINNQRLEQLTAHYETSRLETELEKANRKAHRAMIYAGVLLLILLAGAAALLLERKKKKE